MTAFILSALQISSEEGEKKRFPYKQEKPWIWTRANPTERDHLIPPEESPCLPCERLAEGKLEFGDNGVSLEELPTWMNLELARKGQKFARERLYGIFYSHLIALIFLFAQKDTRKILYYTQKSETAEKALHRYLVTMLQVKLWYDADLQDDPNCPFFKSLARVRNIHEHMGKRVQKESPDFSKPVVVERPLGEDFPEKNYAEQSLSEAFKEDMELSRERLSRGSILGPVEIGENPSGSYYFSQLNMALTLWSFASPPVMYARRFGIYDATEEEWEGFIHLWAIIGHSLGLEPRYNLCLISKSQHFRRYSWETYERYFLPEYFHVNYESEVMWKALAQGMSRIYPFLNVEHLLLQFLEDFVGVPSVQLRKQASWRTCFRRCLEIFIIRPLLHFKWFQRRTNNYIRTRIHKVSEQLLKISSVDLEEVSKRAYY